MMSLSILRRLQPRLQLLRLRRLQRQHRVRVFRLLVLRFQHRVHRVRQVQPVRLLLQFHRDSSILSMGIGGVLTPPALAN